MRVPVKVKKELVDKHQFFYMDGVVYQIDGDVDGVMFSFFPHFDKDRYKKWYDMYYRSINVDKMIFFNISQERIEWFEQQAEKG